MVRNCASEIGKYEGGQLFGGERKRVHVRDRLGVG